MAEFGLGELEKTGLELVVYINSERYCAKELVLFPTPDLPGTPPSGSGRRSGKMETFRCRRGQVWLYVAGEPSSADARPPA